MYVFLNQNVHNRSCNGARYNAGGAGVQPKHYACTKKTALPKPGWFYTHKSTAIGIEQIKVLKQLPGGKFQCEQRMNGQYVTSNLILSTNDIRLDYIKVVASKE